MRNAERVLKEIEALADMLDYGLSRVDPEDSPAIEALNSYADRLGEMLNDDYNEIKNQETTCVDLPECEDSEKLIFPECINLSLEKSSIIREVCSGYKEIIRLLHTLG